MKAVKSPGEGYSSLICDFLYQHGNGKREAELKKRKKGKKVNADVNQLTHQANSIKLLHRPIASDMTARHWMGIEAARTL